MQRGSSSAVRLLRVNTHCLELLMRVKFGYICIADEALPLFGQDIKQYIATIVGGRWIALLDHLCNVSVENGTEERLPRRITSIDSHTESNHLIHVT